MLNCSDASRGSSVGKWSIDTTDRAGTPFLDTLSVCHTTEPKKDVLERYRDGWIREGGIDAINGYGIERIGGITADIHGDGQPSRLTRRVDLCLCEERRNQRREVDAVDEDIDIEDLLEWSTLGCLRQIPFEDIISEIIIKCDRQPSKSRFPHRPRARLTLRDRSCEGGLQRHVHIVQEHRSRGP